MLPVLGESILAMTAAGNHGEAFLVSSDSLLTPVLESVCSHLLQVRKKKCFVAGNYSLECTSARSAAKQAVHSVQSEAMCCLLPCTELRHMVCNAGGEK